MTGGAYGELSETRERAWTPAIDLVRDDGNLLVRAEVPGIKPDEIAIEVDHGLLTLSGKHEEPSPPGSTPRRSTRRPTTACSR
jgi:HSP20 family molecular chaperone IbpA